MHLLTHIQAVANRRYIPEEAPGAAVPHRALSLSSPLSDHLQVQVRVLRVRL